MKQFYVLTFILFCSINVPAQGLPGYLLTLQGDSLVGRVAEKRHQRLLFYPADGGARLTLRASQIRGYGLLGRSAIRSRVAQMDLGTDSTLFVLPVEVGRVSLFSDANEAGIFLRPTTSDTLQELTARNWPLLSNRYLQGCPTLDLTSPQVIDMRFTPENVARVVSRYNACSGASSQSNRPITASPWRYGLGLQMNALAVTSYTRAPFTNEKSVDATGWSKQVGIEWTAVRASGVQVGLGINYKQLNVHNQPYQDQLTQTIILEKQDYSRVQFLTTYFMVSKRLGRPDRPSFFGSLGLNSNFAVRIQEYTQQRIAGTDSEFQKINDGSASGGGTFVPHLEAQGGVLFPLNKQQEIRLTAVYQNYVFSHINGVGAQLAYYWFWK